MNWNRYRMGLLSLMFVACFIGCNMNSNGAKLRIFPGQTVSGYIDSHSNQDYVLPQTLLAVGGDPHNGYSWSCSQYPAGVTVTAGTGVFTTTGGSLLEGQTQFTMTVSDGTSEATAKVTLTVTKEYPIPGADVQQMNVAAFALDEATANKPYGASVFAQGGTPPYTFTEDNTYSGKSDFDASGLVIDASKGIVRGTLMETASGKTLKFRVIVRDATGESEGGNSGIDPVYSIPVK
jgi:hypothetical protein